LFQNIINWWRQKPSDKENDDSGYTLDEYVDVWSYKTTLIKDLQEISKILNPKSLESIIEKLKIYEEDDEVKFETKGLHKDFVKECVNLKTLCEDWQSYVHNYREWLDKDIVRWEASYSEYKRHYETDQHLYNSSVIEPLLNIVRENFNNRAYSYIFCKYEDSIHIVLNAIKDSIEYNGELTEEVFIKSKFIIEKLRVVLNEKQKEIEHIEKLQQEAAQKSIVGRLDAELEFIDRYIEV
jgi:hypothetical protein